MGLAKVRIYWRCFYRSFHYEVRLASRTFIIHWITWIFPIILYALLAGLFAENTLLDLPVAAVDNDNSQLSRQLIREFDATAHAKIIPYKYGLNPALRDLEQANIYSILYIPVGFEKEVLAGKQPTPELYYNALFYGSGYFSTQDYPTLISTLNNSYQNIVAARYGIPLPQLSNPTVVYNSLFNATSSYSYYQQFAATIHIIQMFIVSCMIYVLSRRTELLYAKPFAIALLGKLLPYTLTYTATLMCSLAGLILFSGAHVAGNPLYMLLISIFYVVAAQAIGVLLFTFTKSAITAYSLISLLIASAMTYSGMVVPELSMPLPAQIISNIQPLTHALYAMFDVFLRDVKPLAILEVCSILAIYPTVVALLIRNRIKRRLHIAEGK
ncbi:ABC transporter permease [Entomomonas sp. E2T0]|uniref:ABC transporter permease n=1 Tax=Entomomonas sp. E2T0 TaxID=2930213 RepID=UPI0022281E4C|nr:ABC transporter permease [Entomomonas sp. E2T0]UYZ85168.1 ABC transporter permease [Entomomonas sp. E2T0]